MCIYKINIIYLFYFSNSKDVKGNLQRRRAIYCQGFGSSPRGPICSSNNTFYLLSKQEGGV